MHVHGTIVNYARGTAINIESEAIAELDTGMTSKQWGQAKLSVDGPLITQVAEPGAELDLESLFAFGLERLLDGMATVNRWISGSRVLSAYQPASSSAHSRSRTTPSSSS
ncbi:hypothetical protein [Nonomuraea sp. NPDC005692]|uniref:hypothetical protein n=1 Tax=Nonomuraea sp. NPDC005692 TaxID=3157168 RepID=UPI0034090537